MNKKIALLHFAYPPSSGGVEKLIKDHVEILQRMDFKIKILTGSTIPLLSSINKFETDSDFYDTSDKILKILEKNLRDCDAVIVHNMLSLYRNLPFVYAFKKYVRKNPNKRYINWIHDHILIEKNKVKDINLSKFTRELLAKPIENVKYVTISNSFAVFLKKVLKIQVSVIPDGLDLQKELEISDEMWEFVNKYKILSRVPLFLCPANIVERKNIEFSIDVLSRLKAKYPKALLIVTGDSSKHKNTLFYFRQLKSLVKKEKLKNNVIFLTDIFDKPRSDKDIRDLYKLCDAVLYFSKSENFGLPIIETSLFRVPIFVSDLKVFREIGKADLKYLNIRKPQDAVSSIEKFVETDKRFKMRNRVKSEYNLENILKEKLLPSLNV